MARFRYPPGGPCERDNAPAQARHGTARAPAHGQPAGGVRGGARRVLPAHPGRVRAIPPRPPRPARLRAASRVDRGAAARDDRARRLARLARAGRDPGRRLAGADPHRPAAARRAGAAQDDALRVRAPVRRPARGHVAGRARLGARAPRAALGRGVPLHVRRRHASPSRATTSPRSTERPSPSCPSPRRCAMPSRSGRRRRR